MVILARYSSTRLPGKALKEIAGKPILRYILERVQQVVAKSKIVLATSIESTDDPIVAFAKQNELAYYRGSLTNVARRFYEAAQTLQTDYAVRINGDNIFMDSGVLANIIERAKSGSFDFLSNVKNRTYPKGMSVEAVNMAYYAKYLPHIEADAALREHVLVYLYSRASDDAHYYLENTALPSAAGIQLALDTAADFKRTAWMIEQMDKPHTAYQLPEIMKLYQEYEQTTKR